MRTVSLVALCLLLAGPALAESDGKSVGEQVKSVGESTGVNSLIGVSPTTADFVKEVAISDMFEKQSSQLAAEKADEKTKAFAKKMISDHEKTSEDLKSLVTGGKVKADVPTALDSSHQSKLDKLKDLSGDDFTKQYQSDQVSAHKMSNSIGMGPPIGFQWGPLSELGVTPLVSPAKRVGVAQPG